MLAGAAIVVLLVLAVVDLLRIRHDLDQGQQLLTTLDFKSVDEHGGIAPIANEAASDLNRAADRAASSPWLSALSHLPYVGDQLHAVRDLTRAADQVGELGRATAADVQTALDQGADRGPAGRVQLVDAVSAAADRLETGLRDVDVGARGSLLAPLRTAREDLVRHLQNATSRLDDGRTTLATLRGFLVGPRHYLILGGNNAEMRSTGIATTSGVATITGGAVTVGPFVDGSKTNIRHPGVPIPEGWDWLYGYLDPDIQYANMVSSPNFALTGSTAAALSERNVHGPVDGVIYVDTVSLQVLLSVVGPVTVDGLTYDDTNAARQLVNENYLRFGGDFSNAEQRDRRDAQGRVANAIFDALNSRHVSLVKLAARLQELAKARHLQAWSSVASEEKLWHDVGADGVHDPNDLLVTVQDLGASKLDFYVTENIAMNVRSEGDDRRVELSVSITNPTRAASSTYIDGGSIFANPGEYGFYLVAFLPHDAFDVIHDDPSWTSAATDGPFQVTTFTARAPIGTTRTINLSFLLPPQDSSITILPTARLRPVTWTWGATQFRDLFPTTLSLIPVPAGPEPPRPGWLLTGLTLMALGAALAGDAWGRLAVASGQSPRAHFDANTGWWLMVTGAAMVVVQITLYVRA